MACVWRVSYFFLCISVKNAQSVLSMKLEYWYVQDIINIRAHTNNIKAIVLVSHDKYL